MLVITPVKYRVNVERSESLWTDTVHSYVPLSDVSLQEYLQYSHHLPKRWSLPGLCVPALQHRLVDSVRAVLQWATLRWLNLYWAGRYNSTPSNTPWVCMRKGCVHIPLFKILDCPCWYCMQVHSQLRPFLTLSSRTWGGAYVIQHNCVMFCRPDTNMQVSWFSKGLMVCICNVYAL